MPQPQSSNPAIRPGGKLGMMSRLNQPGTAAPAAPAPAVSTPSANPPPAAQEAAPPAKTAQAGRLYDLRHTFRMGDAENRRFKLLERHLDDRLSEKRLPVDRSMLLRALLAMAAKRIGDDAFVAELIEECVQTPPATPGTGAPRKAQ